ncbi:MAG TPA: hydrogenase maturation nickel metallochaperone HypA [Candidatus Limnocylindrales bacterium]|jgi:hydrogenase nickel incorporation protein HypA/HybF|nr:hydrogenase maturation nickel metallochaperone HypA [Candidatus Limnocylindrales bacterium]
MHEMGIANSVLEAVKVEAELRPGMRVAKVCVRVGELSGVDPEALRFCFDALVKETPLETVSLEIEFRPRRHRCPACGREFDVTNFETKCPGCGEPATLFFAGTELELAYLEMEEA